MKTKLLLIASFLLVLNSCNPRVVTKLHNSYPTLNYKEDVFVYGLNQALPDNCEVLGQVKVGDTGFSTRCGYALVLDKAKLAARKAGGNAISIIKHKSPNIWSTCHRIRAKILRIEDVEELQSKQKEQEVIGADHAVFYIYRHSGVGFLLNYDLYLGDTLLCRVKHKYKTKIKVDKEGLNTIWAKTEAKTEVPIDVEFGKIYYIKCGVKMGLFIGRPSIKIVDKSTGKSEYQVIDYNPEDKK